MVMEFWTGWFDNWNEPHLKRNILPNELATKVESILQRGASMNFYMFHGREQTMSGSMAWSVFELKPKIFFFLIGGTMSVIRDHVHFVTAKLCVRFFFVHAAIYTV